MELDTRINQINEALAAAIQPPDDLWLAAHHGDWYSPYYGFMYHLARIIKPNLSFETGVHNGRASASLAVGYPDGMVVGVDPHDHPMLDNVRQHCKNFVFLQSSSTFKNTIDYITNLPHKIDILHFDTEHSYGQVMNEWIAHRNSITNGTVLLFDDTHACDDSVLRAVYDLPLRWRMKADWLHPVCGYAIGIL